MAARPRFTSRATVLVLVLCSLVAILAYPTRQFISQRAEISAQRAKADHARQQVDQLRRDKARWQDPEYVKAQARARLHYAVPGETPYIAVDPSGAVAQPSASATTATPSADAAAGPAKAAKPWYASIWDSVDAADTDTAALAPATPRPLPPSPVGDPTPHDH
ncbi:MULTISPECIES: FtsB family cell division protein [Kitasatospora]|uniref:Septum formation initiator family protein n=1 Tax=Kitasatospora cathayae TaxID=3004092 RepID=A0ABY7Q4W5_9ACTN|nr:septum formation initiator family protein [Kitasatospora sp. HUAS 3-15]WBP87276.1 septum formation initiator family protein [Kitasatospora sp. HUAS 3-15]